MGTEIPGEILVGTEIPGEVLVGTEIPGEVLVGLRSPGEVLVWNEIPGEVLGGGGLRPQERYWRGTEIPGEVLVGDWDPRRGTGRDWDPKRATGGDWDCKSWGKRETIACATVTTRMSLHLDGEGAIFMFHYCIGQSEKAVYKRHNLLREKRAKVESNEVSSAYLPYHFVTLCDASCSGLLQQGVTVHFRFRRCTGCYATSPTTFTHPPVATCLLAWSSHCAQGPRMRSSCCRKPRLLCQSGPAWAWMPW